MVPPGEADDLLLILLDNGGHPRPEPRDLLLLISPEAEKLHTASEQGHYLSRVTIIHHLKTPCLWRSAQAKSELLTLRT